MKYLGIIIDEHLSMQRHAYWLLGMVLQKQYFITVLYKSLT